MMRRVPCSGVVEVPKGAGAVPGLKRSRLAKWRMAIGRRMGWAWQPLLFVGVLLGLLLGRALPGAHVAPFGIAFYAAVRGAGFSAANAVPVALAAIIGSWTVLPFSQVLWVTSAVALAHIASSALVALRSQASPLAAGVIASVSVTAPLVVMQGTASVMYLVFWSGLTGVLALIFSLGITDASSGRLSAQGSADSVVPAIVILAAALSGLEGLAPWPWLSLRDAAAGLLVMACAYAGGPPMGAAAGAVLGISFLFTVFGSEMPPVDGADAIAPAVRSMAYVVAGLLAGTFRELGKAGVAVAFSLGFVTTVTAIPGSTDSIIGLSATAGTAALLFLATPLRWLLNLPPILVSRKAVGGEGEQRQAPPVSAVLLERVTGMSRVLREVSRTFEQVAAVEAPAEHGAGTVHGQISDRVCRSCSLYQHCWEKEFHKTYQLIADLWERVEEEGPLSTQSAPAELEKHCIYSGQVVFTLNYLSDIQGSRQQWERRIEEGREVVSDYLKNISRMMDRFVEEVGSQTGYPTFGDNSVTLKVLSGIARLPKRGSHISGDSFLGEALGAERYLLALSDGMGVGRKAATESRQCVRLLHEILQAGFTPEVAVKTVNSALLLHSPDESFATVDLTLLDLTTGRAEFVKIGAAPSFIKRGSDITLVKMPSVPIGIINHVPVEPEYRVLRPGDILIMITDGIWDVCKNDTDKERWLLEHLRRETSSDPEEVAESLLARALELLPEAEDDMTVLVARVDPAGSSRSGAERRIAGNTWMPAKQAPRISTEPLQRNRL